jgi:hypothetical protein
MITTALLNLFYNVIIFITTPIRNLADVSLNSSLGSAITTAGSYLHSLDVLLPMATILAILGVSLAFEAIYLTYKLIMWVIKKIPMIN